MRMKLVKLREKQKLAYYSVRKLSLQQHQCSLFDNKLLADIIIITAFKEVQHLLLL